MFVVWAVRVQLVFWCQVGEGDRGQRVYHVKTSAESIDTRFDSISQGSNKWPLLTLVILLLLLLRVLRVCCCVLRVCC